jgi:hypothetical protein
VLYGVKPWGIRRVISHIKGLPTDSAVVRKHQGDYAGWDTSTELQATSVDLIHALLNVTVAAHGGEAQDFKPVPRPYKIEQEPEQAVGLAGLTDFLKG